MDGIDSMGPKGKFLVVDDEEHIREILMAALEPISLASYMAGSADEALDIIREENVDVVVCDIQMPGMNGLEFLLKAKQEQPELKFLMITAHGTMETVIQAMRHGASDFLTKPFENAKVREIIGRLLREKWERIEAVLDPLGSDVAPGIPRILGSSPKFKACLEMALKAARSDSTILILGESGTGKEVMARSIHDNSPRAGKAFIPINCGAIPENLLESELFGYEKGAFTGAISSKPGKFLLAEGGTVFLDEIGEMPMPMQVKLLRVLQEKTIDPVGSSHSRKVDFRLVTATNRNLKEDVKIGGFREDLYYRLNIIPLELPPLRDRGDDILLLADYFLTRFNERYGCEFSLRAQNHRELLAHGWPGNIRELENVIERAIVLGYGDKLELNLPQAADSGSGEASLDFKGRKQLIEKEEILKSLERNRWNKTKAASDLGISRRSLLYKVKEYGIG